jgi:hypothetical protein
VANELQVIAADGSTKTLRSIRHADGSDVQVLYVVEGPEVPVSPTGGLIRYTVDNSPAVPLDPPTAAAKYCRLRVYEASTSTPDSKLRLYYRTDGTAPTADGANAFGFLLHGELILVKLADFTKWQCIAEGTGVFQVYAEWLGEP